MTVRLRPFCSDVRIQGYDEAWTAFIMIALALVYSITMLGPWGTVKAWANIGDIGNWRGFLGYAAIVWTSAMLLLPGVWLALAALGRFLSGSREIPTTTLFLRYTYVLVPIGLCAWIAFGFPLILVNGTHILATISDPMGWGWDLVGTTQMAWAPLWPEYMAYIQIPILLFGLAYGLKRGFGLGMKLYRDARRACRSMLTTA